MYGTGISVSHLPYRNSSSLK